MACHAYIRTPEEIELRTGGGYDIWGCLGFPSDWQIRREIVLERDGFECQNMCGQTDGLQIHHLIPRRPIDPYDYGATPSSHDIGNLVTLCEDCHRGATEYEIEQREAARRERDEGWLD